MKRKIVDETSPNLQAQRGQTLCALFEARQKLRQAEAQLYPIRHAVERLEAQKMNLDCRIRIQEEHEKKNRPS